MIDIKMCYKKCLAAGVKSNVVDSLVEQKMKNEKLKHFV